MLLVRQDQRREVLFLLVQAENGVSQRESFLAEGAPGAQVARAERRFVDQLQGQPGLDGLRAAAGPGAEQVPSAQAQMVGEKQPDTDQVAGDFVGQQLADLTFQALRIGWGRALFLGGALGENRPGRRFGIKRLEFFFEGRNRQMWRLWGSGRKPQSRNNGLIMEIRKVCSGIIPPSLIRPMCSVEAWIFWKPSLSSLIKSP